MSELYYGAYTKFYIDGIPFPMPQNFEPELKYSEIEKRSISNVLTVDKFDYEMKHEFNFDWSLTPLEFEQLQVWLNQDFVPIIIDMNGNAQQYEMRLKYTKYKQIGERIDITVNAKEL